MSINKIMFAAAACAAMLSAAQPQETAGELAYFTKDAFDSADMSGIADDIESTLSQCPAAFAAAEDLAATRTGRERDAILTRVEIARSLRLYIRARHSRDPGAKDKELLAWQGAMEMQSFFAYFNAERLRNEARRKQPPPVELNVRDFGAKGDGTADDGPAIRQALAAAKEKSPAPVVVRIPAGTYLVRPDTNTPPEKVKFPSCRFYDADGKCRIWQTERPWKSFGAGVHIACHGLANLTIQGETGTEIRFTDSTLGGFGFWGCTETMVKDIAISYRDNPSTQGTILSVEKNPVSFVLKRDPGYPDPDEKRFLDAYSNRFTAHEGKGQLFARGGTGRMGTVERLSADTFRFRPFEHMKNHPYWLSRKAGERISVIARYSESARGCPVYMLLCSFSGAERVTVYDAPGQNFIFPASTAMWLIDCTVRVRPGSDDLVSSNADGCMGSGMIGPYIAGCRFEDMEDDGINIGTTVTPIDTIAENRLSCVPGPDGTAAFQVDGVTGLIKGFLRTNGKGRLRAPLGKDAISTKMLGEAGKKDKKKWTRFNSWEGKAGEVKQDSLIHIPGTVGAIVKDTSFRNLRGMGIQVHCADMLVENVDVTQVTGPGMNINPLFGWGMLFNVHNIIARNCRFRDVSTGFVVQPGCVQPGITLKQKMIQGIRLLNNTYELKNGRYAVAAENAQDVEVDENRFSLCLKRGQGSSVTYVRSEDADRILMSAKPDGDEEIVYTYRKPASPVREARVTVRRDADGAIRRRLSCTLADGWILVQVSPQIEIACSEAKPVH